MPSALLRPKNNVSIDATFLARVYHGPDPEGFARFIGMAAADPRFFVYAEQPDILAVLEVQEGTHGLGRVAYGHCLAGEFSLLSLGIDVARRFHCDNFLYPIDDDKPNAAQLARIITRRYGFKHYQTLYRKSLDHGS